MTNDEKRQACGKAGEVMVTNRAIAAGHTVWVPPNQYDSVRDIKIDGENCEVKTQAIYVRNNHFSIRPNQMRKCSNARYVYFVAEPLKWYHPANGKIWRIAGKDIVYGQQYIPRGGDPMVPIMFDLPGMEFVDNLTDEENSILTRYSLSAYAA